MAGAKIVLIRSWLRNASRPFSLEMSTSSIGHLAGERSDLASAKCQSHVSSRDLYEG
jgi:hypothetical protein